MGAGSGRIVLRRHGAEAAFSELSYVYPLKLLSPRLSPENASVVYVVSYGGGLVGGDRIQLSVVVDEGAALVMLTQVRPLLHTIVHLTTIPVHQGSTKVFKNRPGGRLSSRSQGTSADAVTTQTLDVSVARGGALFLLPDPVTCFRSAAYNQIQVFRLHASASLVLLDWVTSGRKSLGEEWAFSRYYSKNEVWIEDRRLAKDVMLLEEQKPVPSLPLRTLAESLAPYSCYATLIMCGPLIQNTLASLSAEFGRLTVFKQARPQDLLWSFSAISDGVGCVVRVAGTETELVKSWLGEKLVALEGAMGPDIYRRAFG